MCIITIKLSIAINVLESQWFLHYNEEEWYRFFEKILKYCPPIDPDLEISLCLTNDEHIRSLNKQFRDKDYPTNVLSFPSEDPSVMGDIVLSFETVKKEADDFLYHVAFLFVHGVLHLLGYDHITEEDRVVMEELEEKILKDWYAEH